MGQNKVTGVKAHPATSQASAGVWLPSTKQAEIPVQTNSSDTVRAHLSMGLCVFPY